MKCPKCKNQCNFREDQNLWYCTNRVKVPKKKIQKCNYSVSDFKGSFLSGIHLKGWKLILLVNHWLQKIWNRYTVIKCLCLSPNTSIDWRSFCSEVTEHWFGNQEAVGGPGVVVEIDESQFGKRKYQCGRVSSEIWVFGGTEGESKKNFVISLIELIGTHRDVETLLPLIQKYILPGSIIISYCWRAYSKIKDLGYDHSQINHSENFVDPSNADTHTQSTERFWRDLKEWMKRPGNKSPYYTVYLKILLYRKVS